MKKVTVRVGQYDGSEKDIVFIGELRKTQQEFDAPNDKSRGTEYALYRVPQGYRVYEKRWANGQGQKRQNYAKLSKVLTQAELLKKFASLANYAGIFETEDLDTHSENETTILLAVNRSSARLLPYTLANVDELIEMGRFLLDQEDVPDDIQAEIKGVIDRIEG